MPQERGSAVDPTNAQRRSAVLSRTQASGKRRGDMAHRRRTARSWRLAASAVATSFCVAAVVAATSLYPASSSGFTGTAVNAANTFGTDSLDPPGSFASSRPCTATSARLRAATTAVSSVAASITVAVPATVVGDYLVALVGTQDSPPPPIPTAAQTGWTQATTNTQGNERLTIFTRPTPATPPASYSFTIPTGASVVATMMS